MPKQGGTWIHDPKIENRTLYWLSQIAASRPLKFLIFNSGKWRFLNKSQTWLISPIFADAQDIRKKITTNFSAPTSASLQPAFPRPPHSQWSSSQEGQGPFPVFPCNQLEETTLHIGNESLSLLAHAQPLAVHQPAPRRTTQQTVGAPDEPQQVPVSESLNPLPFVWVLWETHHFRLSS